MEEFERIRGFKFRWYELKIFDFYREVKRNNDIFFLLGYYGDIMEYRDQLLFCVGEEKVVR